ncbi:MAG: ATP-dependent exoDNAse (exonuclease V) beta subunit [Alcanivorax sp.]|jgi:ATP-dependent exoDNAse (exonuclease V) beta subunit
MIIVDAPQRAAALDTQRSFCISAPAGSGKTELLIQRYLALLATVERPEQIVAITFTRKAAAEMRERIIGALKAAQEGLPCDTDHEQTTRQLALQGLACDREKGWRLAGNVSRLNVKTIDSFCAGLTRQMPVLSSFGGQASATDDPAQMYTEAVRELFDVLNSDRSEAKDLSALLLHFDNNWDRMEELLVAMLARRDQWREYVGVRHSPQESENYLLEVVRDLVGDALGSLQTQLMGYREEILELLRYQAENTGQHPVTEFPESRAADLDHWRQVSSMLLTKTGGWRAKVDKSMGFPAGKGSAGEFRDRLKAIIADLREIEGLDTQLSDVNYLPAMDGQSTSWKLVLNLSRVLPLLAVNLLLVFQRHGLVDHSQVALSALDALGDDDEPTDLAMRLDYGIEHILLDEFQDTAINQFELVRRLTRGWHEHNQVQRERPRTLLVVGDGMQSIYGFRDANVSLFLQARDHGFNGLKLDYLQLSSNFRSRAGIVDWVNQTFADAFPETDDVSRGQVAFSAAQAVKPADASSAVHIQAFRGENAAIAETEFICNQVEQRLAADSESSIAILGRTRNQLRPILQELKIRDVGYAAQDIETLRDTPVIMDLTILCRALSNRFDRLAWLSLLRAPWCGLALADLLAVARDGDDPRHALVPVALTDETLLASLSSDGQNRLRFVAECMQWADTQRDRLALRSWVEQLWLRLGGPAVINNRAALIDAEKFFQLLELADTEGVGLDLEWLQRKLDRLYADPGDSAARLQIMTLHKAKGLEFDCVVIPDLSRRSRSDSRALLLWDERSTASGQRQFLLAADDHSEDSTPSLYNYLRQERKRKVLLENTRLLYVGATRAISRLILTASPGYDDSKACYKKPGDMSLLACIWPTFNQQLIDQDTGPSEPRTLLPASAKYMRHKRVAEVVGEEQALCGPTNIPRHSGNLVDRLVGTVVHRLLEQLAHQDVLPPSCEQEHIALSDFALRSLGLHGAAVAEAQDRVLAIVNVTLADAERGRWLLSSAHEESACELRLSTADEEGRARDIIIDRTFIDRITNVRWIVDYKTSQPADDQSLPGFLKQESAKYSDQLASYAQALLIMGTAPIRTALYFASIGHFHPLDLPSESSE